MPVSLNLCSFCILIGLPLQDLLVQLCDEIKSETKKLRCSVITGLSSVPQELMTRQKSEAELELSVGWRPNRSSCFCPSNWLEP